MVLSILVAGAAGPMPGSAQEGADELSGRWEGSLMTPTGAELSIIFNIEPNDDGWSVTWDSPDQGAVGLPAGSPTLTDGVVVIPLPVIQGRYEGTLEPGSTVVDGTFYQGPASMPLRLTRTAAEATRLERPQEPVGPFPYHAEDVRYANARAEGVELAGTLTLPEGSGPHPAAVLISGSGPQDRNEALAGHKPFLVLADYLSRRGIAVLRFDDRGVGESTGTFGTATSEDFATDVRAGVEYLLTRSEIDASRIGLIGHSEGGLIAPLVANATDDVAYLVLMAGPGVRGDEILLQQSELIARADGANEAGIRLNLETQRALFPLVQGADDPSTVRGEVRQILEDAIDRVREIDAAAAEAQEQQIAAQTVQLTSPWFHFFLSHDPREPLRRLSQPVLAINGSKDLQVVTDPNLLEIERALAEAGNSDVTIHEFEGLNHLFQSAESGSPTEYAEITETLSPRVLQVIAGWIADRMIDGN